MSFAQRAAFLQILTLTAASTVFAFQPLPENPGASFSVAPNAPAPAPTGKYVYSNERGVFVIDPTAGTGSANYTWFDNTSHTDALQPNFAIGALNNPEAPGGRDPVYTFKVAGQNWWWSFSLLPFNVPGNPAQLYRVYYSHNGTTFFRFLTNNGTRRVETP